MADRLQWTDIMIATAKKKLSQATSLPEALADISTALKRNVSRAALDSEFKRRNLATPYSMLAPPPLHPVEAAIKREEESDLRRKFNKLVEELREANARQDFLDAMSKYREPPRIMPREKKSGLREAALIVLGSDWHVEETVNPETIAGVNEYNLAIAEARIKRFFNAIIWQVEHHRASARILIRSVIAWLGGDLMTGYIHEELVEGNSLSPTQTILWLTPLIVNGLMTVLERLELEELVVPCSFGNHGRTTEKRRVSTGYKNSFEWLMYHQLSAILKHEKRIRFEITSSAHQYVQAYDYWLHFHHGDETKYNGGVGGLGVPLLKRIPKWDQTKYCDFHHVGHFHQYLDFGRVVVNGSLIGFNPFAQSIGADPEPPQQASYLLDSTRGKCQMSPLWVGDDKHEAKAA